MTHLSLSSGQSYLANFLTLKAYKLSDAQQVNRVVNHESDLNVLHEFTQVMYAVCVIITASYTLNMSFSYKYSCL